MRILWNDVLEQESVLACDHRDRARMRAEKAKKGEQGMSTDGPGRGLEGMSKSGTLHLLRECVETIKIAKHESTIASISAGYASHVDFALSCIEEHAKEIARLELILKGKTFDEKDAEWIKLVERNAALEAEIGVYRRGLDAMQRDVELKDRVIDLMGKSIENGLKAVDSLSSGSPSVHWSGELFECPGCGVEVVTGFGAREEDDPPKEDGAWLKIGDELEKPSIDWKARALGIHHNPCELIETAKSMVRHQSDLMRAMPTSPVMVAQLADLAECAVRMSDNVTIQGSGLGMNYDYEMSLKNAQARANEQGRREVPEKPSGERKCDRCQKPISDENHCRAGHTSRCDECCPCGWCTAVRTGLRKTTKNVQK